MKILTVRESYLFIEYSEPYQLGVGIALIQEIAETSRHAGLHKVLCDVRGMLGKIPVMEIFQLAVAGASAFRGLQVAGVYRKEDIDPFAEAVIQNRGGNVRIFSSIAKAKEWLSVE
jgi:hypothetical protein